MVIAGLVGTSPASIKHMAKNNTSFKTGHPPTNTGRTWFQKGYSPTPEHRRRLSEALKGHPIYQSAARNRKISESLSGSKNYAWKGGLTPINKAIRNSAAYKRWRRAVLERDGNRCYDCGTIPLAPEADHMFPFSQFPRLRFFVENGITRCRDCHQRTPTYGGRLKN